MDKQFERSALLVGDDAVNKLKKSAVAVFGVGGVGSYTIEALARSGVGKIILVDNDTVSESNINRQLIALHSTVGLPKVEVAASRIKDINPNVHAVAFQQFFDSTNCDDFDFCGMDYIVDAIDTVSSKLLLIEKADEYSVPIISCMGAGNKLDATRFEVTDIYKTSVCPLARVMRYELKRRGIKKLKVVYSTEPPCAPDKAKFSDEPNGSRRQTPGSMAYAPSVAGLIAAGEVIKDLIK